MLFRSGLFSTNTSRRGLFPCPRRLFYNTCGGAKTERPTVRRTCLTTTCLWIVHCYRSNTTLKGDLLAKVEQALLGHAVGDSLDLHLEPEDAFGDFDEHLIHLAPRAMLPKDLEEGVTIEGSSLPKDCCPEADRSAFYTVSEIYPEHVILDGNHPLAGIAIRLSMQVRDVRPATTEEQERGTLGVGFFSLG